MPYHDHAAVLIYPPALWLASFTFGLLANFIFPLPVGAALFLRALGVLLAIPAGVVLAWAGAVFKELEEHPDPTTPTRRLIKDGPYRYSRNPMYLAAGAALFGVALLFGNWWLIFSALVNFIILDFGVIRREEVYLSRRFGAEYEDYKKNVPRWV